MPRKVVYSRLVGKVPRRRHKGRPSKRTEATVRTILDATADGGTRAEVAKLAGISRSTLQSWLAKGWKDPTYYGLRGAVFQAELDGITARSMRELQRRWAGRRAERARFRAENAP